MAPAWPAASCALATALLFSPFLYRPWWPGAGFHDPQRVLQLAVLVVAAWAWCVAWPSAAVAVHPSRVVSVSLIGFFGFGLVASGGAFSVRHALTEWLHLLLLWTLAWCVAHEIARHGPHWMDRLLAIVGIGCALYAMLAMAIALSMAWAGQQPLALALLPGFDNVRFFSHAQTVSLPLLALLAVRIQDPTGQRFWWAVTAMWWSLLFVSGGRGTLLGVLAGTALVSTMWADGVARYWCRALWLSGLAGLLLYLLVYVAWPLSRGLVPFGFFSDAIARSVGDPVNGRWPLWSLAADLVLANPLWGVGPMHYAHEARDLQLGAHPHNWLLQLASEWGVVATGFAVLAIAMGLWHLWCARRLAAQRGATERQTMAAWLVVGLAVLTDGMVSGSMVMPVSQLWVAFYLGCAWGWLASQRPKQQPRQAVGHRWWYRARAVCAAAVVLVLVWGVAPELMARLSNETVAASPQPTTATFRPRMWRDGFF